MRAANGTATWLQCTNRENTGLPADVMTNTCLSWRVHTATHTIIARSRIAVSVSSPIMQSIWRPLTAHTTGRAFKHRSSDAPSRSSSPSPPLPSGSPSLAPSNAGGFVSMTNAGSGGRSPRAAEERSLRARLVDMRHPGQDYCSLPRNRHRRLAAHQRAVLTHIDAE